MGDFSLDRKVVEKIALFFERLLGRMTQFKKQSIDVAR